MNGNKVNVAAFALIEKLVKPVIAAIGDGRGTKFYLASKRLHMLLPTCHCFAGRKSSLAWMVWLVETEEVLASLFDPVDSIAVPPVGVVALRAPEHRNEFSKGLLGICSAVPVIMPVNLGIVAFEAATKLCDGDIVICGQTALWRGGGSCRQQQGRSHNRTEVKHRECFVTLKGVKLRMNLNKRLQD